MWLPLSNQPTKRNKSFGKINQNWLCLINLTVIMILQLLTQHFFGKNILIIYVPFGNLEQHSLPQHGRHMNQGPSTKWYLNFYTWQADNNLTQKSFWIEISSHRFLSSFSLEKVYIKENICMSHIVKTFE